LFEQVLYNEATRGVVNSQFVKNQFKLSKFPAREGPIQVEQIFRWGRGQAKRAPALDQQDSISENFGPVEDSYGIWSGGALRLTPSPPENLLNLNWSFPTWKFAQLELVLPHLKICSA
jgi:hypothetical protein